MRSPVVDGRLLRRVVRSVGPAMLGLAAFVLLIAHTGNGWSVATGWLTLAVCAWLTYRNPLGRYIGARTVVAAGFTAAAYMAASASWVVIVAGLALLGTLLLESTLAAVAGPRYFVDNLPLRGGRLDPVLLARISWVVTTLLNATIGVVVVWPEVVWALVPLAISAVAVPGLLFADAWDRRRRNRGADLQVMRQALERVAPAFALYFSSPPGMAYQATMWLPYLERVGEPFIVLLRESHSKDAISDATSAPVVVCPSLAALDAALVPSLRAVFYVNNGMKNSHCVRFSELEHVQLLHGDSDMAPSFNPVTAMFDKIFVAGQAGIDRYAANGVQIPQEKFRIVGRPQVESLAVAEQGISEVSNPVVLYAPTWIGLYNDVNYCSLPIGERIVRALLDRGATVILRHHPFAKRDRGSVVRLHRIERLLAADRSETGRPHLWGDAASTERTLFDCIDASHAMVSDVSSVASDFLYTGKPFAITDMVGEGEEFVRTFPLAAASYVIRPDAGNLREVLDELLGRDSLAPVRRSVRTHYLGEFALETYAERFYAEVRECLSVRPSPPVAASGHRFIPVPRPASDNLGETLTGGARS